MASLIRMELGKAFRNPWFLVSSAISTALAVASAVGNIVYHCEYGVFELYTHKYVSPVPDSCFKWWISLDFLQPTSSLLFHLLPLLSVIPYAWSYQTELQCGYLGQVLSRTRRRDYLVAKGIAAFSSGAMVAAALLLINFLLLAAFIPAYIPDITEVLYLGVYPDDIWSWFFYNAPVAYVLLFSALASLICGLWALFVLSLSYLIENRVALLLSPYLASLILQFLSERIYLVLGINGPQLGLAANMRAGTESYAQVWWVIALECAALLLASFLLTNRQVRGDVL